MKAQTKNRIWIIKNTINDNQIKIATIENIIANTKRNIEGMKNRASSLKMSYTSA